MLRTHPEKENNFFQTYVLDYFTPETDAALTPFTKPSTLLPTQYGQTMVTKSCRCGKVHDEYLSKEYSLKACMRRSAIASDCNRARIQGKACTTCHVTEVGFEKGSEYCQNKKHRSGRRGNSRSTVKVVKTGVSTTTTTTTPTNNDSAVIQVGSNPQ